MRRSAEFGVFATVAVLLHLAALRALESGALVAAGRPSSAGAAVSGATAELAELIESWEQGPETTQVEELAAAELADAGPDTPAAMEEPEALSAPAQAEAALPKDRPSVPPEARPPAPRKFSTDMPAPAAPPSAPFRVAPAPEPEIALALPDSPLAAPLPLPPRPEPTPPEAEPEPDPNETPDIATRQTMVAPEPGPEIKTGPDRPVAPARPAAMAPPEAVTPPEIGAMRDPGPGLEPTPAPVVAVIPTAKPEMPESAQPAAQARPMPVREPKSQPARSEPDPSSEPTGRAEPARSRQAPQLPSATAGSAASSDGWDALEHSALPQGAGGAAQAGDPSAAEKEDARQEWLAEVRSAVQREKRYPRQAERRSIEGQSTVRITVEASGRLAGATLAGSSGEALLDEAAMAAVRAVGRYPPIPPEMREASVTITLPFDFRRR